MENKDDARTAAGGAPVEAVVMRNFKCHKDRVEINIYPDEELPCCPICNEAMVLQNEHILRPEIDDGSGFEQTISDCW